MDEHAALLDEISHEMRVTAQWTGRSALSTRVASALGKVRRGAFVPDDLGWAAYQNRPLPIGCGQTISQPYIVALMTEILDLQPTDKVLEVGTGSGYQAAVLAELVPTVYSIEAIAELSQRAGTALASEGYLNVVRRVGNGALGWPDEAPFDAIIVTAAAESIPPALLQQLGAGGRMIIPVGPHRGDQKLILITKDDAGEITQHDLLHVAFVPLTGG
ncbi:MAG TPA: protein-L-isoaspartate(D-aspartate) O-methyltransferase [Acetobacteraceae bacterium]|nr:protein-L-isoaspartate(D-aspartate) O-methyltransferase [Acetobacteraceae bacterium]